MLRVTLLPGADLAGFRKAVRGLFAQDVPPEAVAWDIAGAPGLFDQPLPEGAPPLGLPRGLGELIPLVVCHRDAKRYALLYAAVWRTLRGEKALLDIATDPLVHRLEAMHKSVKRDIHKMHAFVRFRRAETPEGEHFVAWFEPEHFILEAAAPFFARRFPAMRWSILTPVGAAHWNLETVRFGPPATRADAPESDAFEAGWRTYYESIFNPARVNPVAMRSEMPKKYWRNLPEAESIAGLVRGAQAREREMIEKQAATPLRRDPTKAVEAMARQAPASLAELNALIAAAQPMVMGGAPRAVLGEGPAGAAIAFVGEQPGDVEEAAGRPFVGPAGQLFDRALAQAGIDRGATYVTNAVKHFKFEARGKRRIHVKPTAGEVAHYRWWLDAELGFVAPRLTVALGATAALALAGKPLSVTKARGACAFGGRAGFVTVHPSYLLRLPDEAAKAAAWNDFIADLQAVARLAA